MRPRLDTPRLVVSNESDFMPENAFRKGCSVILSVPVLVASLAVGLAFLVYISLAIVDLFEEYQLRAKGK